MKKPTISDMRLYLMSRYPNSLKWHKKVQVMPTRQVVAIYKKFTADRSEKIMCHNPSNYHQIDMFEYLASIEQNHTEVVV